MALLSYHHFLQLFVASSSNVLSVLNVDRDLAIVVHAILHLDGSDIGSVVLVTLVMAKNTHDKGDERGGNEHPA
jgi:hypothetical protein